MNAGNFTLITGASRGIGAAFAEALAAQGQNLVLTARSTADLEALRRRLVRPGQSIICLSADLNRGGAAVVLAALAERGIAIDLLINNAGLGSGGGFETLGAERELEEVRVNVESLVALTHGLLPAMLARGRGAVINVGSTAGFQPVPYLATYAATKAFVLHFSLALYQEMRGRGVHVMALCPGPTETPFFAAAGIRPRNGMQSPQQVVELALRGLAGRRAFVVCGTGNRALIAAERLLPRTILLKIVAGMIQKWHRV
ncbi:MAG TPA: SDR family oxidoreductase [Terriglobales bacterium]